MLARRACSAPRSRSTNMHDSAPRDSASMPERAGAGEQVGDRRAVDETGAVERVEHGLADLVGRRTGGQAVRHHQLAPAELTGHDADHGCAPSRLTSSAGDHDLVEQRRADCEADLVGMRAIEDDEVAALADVERTA